MRLLLRAHHARLAGRGIEEPRLLIDSAARFEHADLPRHLEVDRGAEEAEGVQILDLRARAERLAGAAHRHVRVAAQRSFLHVPVAHLGVHEDLPQPREVLRGVLRGADVGLRHDLDERHAGAVEIDPRQLAVVDRLPRVLFHVDAADAHVADAAARRERAIELRDLVALRQVGVEVVLAREDRLLVYVALRRQRRARRELDGAAVQHRQRARIAEANRADMRVRRGTERRRAAAEDLRRGEESRVDLEANDHFPVRHSSELCRSKRLHRANRPISHKLLALRDL